MNENLVHNNMDVPGDAIHEADEIHFLGLTIHPKSLSELNALVAQGIRERRKWIIANHNLHSVYLFHTRPRLREFYAQADYIHIDGMPLVALGRLYGYKLERTQRVTYADWTHPLIALAAAEGWRVFYLGSPKDVAEKGAEELRKLNPGLKIDARDGYFDERRGSLENEAIVDRINAYKPDLLMVGMGMPRQELWIHENFARLNVHVILPSGAAIDYIAGAVATPPRWMGRLGLEWAFRLVSEPGRLFSRYLIEPWYVLMLLAMDFIRKGGKLKTSIK
jgi:N-acetylglucosaminyldiphosphoundecaprenol N-acetyl-beta-D-mannosaminyltransferase